MQSHSFWPLVVLLALSAGACAARGGVPRPFPGANVPATRTADTAPDGDTEIPPLSWSSTATTVVETALSLRGVPYRDGGSDPSGFDCSGLVQYVFAQVGTVLPRQARDQFRVGRPVTLEDVRPGDLIFFETVSPGASHVGLAIGGEQFVHAPNSRGVVRVERVTSSYWSSRFLGVRRIEAPAVAGGGSSIVDQGPSSSLADEFPIADR